MTPEEYAGWIITILVCCAAVFGIMRWFYKKGKKDATHEVTSDDTHVALDVKIDNVDKKISDYSIKNDADHKLFFEKFAAIKSDVSETKSNVSYIKGRIDQALGKK